MKKSVLLAPNEQIPFSDPRIKWPAMGSLKFDGTRGVCIAGPLLTRNMKPQRNAHLPEYLNGLVKVAEGRRLVFDFEIYDPTATHHAVHTSILASLDKPIPDTMQCHIFDVMTLEEWERTGGHHEHTPFHVRYNTYLELFRTHPLLKDGPYVPVEQVTLQSPGEAADLFDIAVEEGFEGIMLRCPHAPYKHGRASHREGIIRKFKAWETIDGYILQVLQRRKMKDGIERTTTPTGHMERVHTKDAFELDDMAAGFLVRFEDGTESEINYGKGFDHAERRKHWQDRESLIGKHVEVRHLGHGAKDGIRIGTLVRFRPDKD